MPPVRGAVLAAVLAVRFADCGYALLAKWCLDGNALGAALVFGLYRNAGALPFMAALGVARDGCACLRYGYRGLPVRPVHYASAGVVPARRDLPHLALLAFTAVFACQACYLIGLKDCNRRAARRGAP